MYSFDTNGFVDENCKVFHFSIISWKINIVKKFQINNFNLIILVV